MDEFGKKYLDSRAGIYGQGRECDQGEVSLAEIPNGAVGEGVNSLVRGLTD